MHWTLETVASVASNGASRRLRVWVQACATTALTRLRDRYQPEKHYMRGPGPACRRKFGAHPAARRGG